MKLKSILIALSLLFFLFSSAQNYSEVLGRPTDNSITISIRFDQACEFYFEYGTTSGNYISHSTITTVAAAAPIEIDLINLSPNTRYYYRTRYRLIGSTTFSSSSEHQFQTWRPKGNSFSFVVEADPHLDSNTTPLSYRLALQHMLSKKPDFLIDLGDNFMSEKLPVDSQNVAGITYRHQLFRDYFKDITHSVPLFLTLGNHEGESGWIPGSTSTSLPALSASIRKEYYPNPYPNNFYSGNTVADPIIGLREDYYAFEWGDALFIVIDPYWYTHSKPGWGWTLGIDQYNWLKRIITTSTAKFKFVFSHQLVGGNGNDARGGVEFAKLFEMGGYNLDGTYGFDSNRPGWSKPVHSLMKENGGSIFFHGHDHFFGKQDLDSIVYQEVPQPSARDILHVTGLEAGYGYSLGTLLANRGYLYVSVTPDSVKVDYIKIYLPNEENATRHNGDIAYTYTIVKKSNATIINNDELVKIDPNPASTSLNIKVKDGLGTFHVTIYNLSGQKIMESSLSQINVSGIPSGMYIIEVSGASYRVTKKIVINR